MTRFGKTRRRFLAAVGATGAVGIAGCLGVLDDDEDIQDSDGDGVIDSKDYAPRDPAVQRKAQLSNCDCTSTPGGSTPAETETARPQQTPAATPQRDAFVDRFERAGITDLEATMGPLEYWSITNGIDGRSLRAQGGGSKGSGGRVRYDPATYSWSGDRRISVRFQSDTSFSKRHAQLFFYDDDVWWQVAAALPLDYLRFRHEERGEIKKIQTPMDSSEPHTLSAAIRGRSISVGFDGAAGFTYTHSEPIGGGTVGFGIGYERATWYDNLRVEPL